MRHINALCRSVERYIETRLWAFKQPCDTNRVGIGEENKKLKKSNVHLRWGWFPCNKLPPKNA